MMLRTKPLLRKPSFLHKVVHHPDPLTSEQTQRFLDTVTTSFRKNLDQEHGWITEEEQHLKTPLSGSEQRHATPTTDGGHNLVADRARLLARGLPRRPTDHHLSSILTNPLFRPAQNVPVETGTKPDPMDVFDVAVSKGLMTLDIARGCMLAKYRIIKSPYGRYINDPSATNESLSSSGVCDRVLGWLQSSGLGRTLEFASHHHFVKAFMPFLVAEGKEFIVWDWISRLLSGSEACSREEDARRMLYDLIRVKTAEYQPVDSAIESIIQASDTYRYHPRHADLLYKAWVVLAWRTTTIAPQKPPASASLFDAYLKLADYFKPLFVKLPIAHLHLHHPATPTHDRALEYFDDMKSEKADRPSLTKGRTMLRREAVMGVDAVHHLSLIGKFEEAESLMAFIKSKYRAFMAMYPDPTLSYLEHS